jgi:hypothetical protein
MSKNPSFYFNVSSLTKSKLNKTIKQIDKDIDRTFPTDSSLNRVALRNILETSAVHNPNAGYCQGLNFIVATLLRVGFSEEESFWMFTQLIENYVPSSYYSSMFGVILDQKVFDHLLRVKQTKLIRHLDKISLDASIINIQWFICLFSFTFDVEIVKKIWDIIIVKGFSAIFLIGLAVLSVLKKKIIEQNDFIEALAVIEAECKALNDFSVIKNALKKNNAIAPFGFICRLRQVYDKEVLGEYFERFERVLDYKYLFESMSYKCIDENECKQKILATDNFFTFTNKGIQMIDEYLDRSNYPKTSHLSSNFLVSGKKNHFCSFEEDMVSSASTPQETLRKTIIMTSTKKTFAAMSTFVNINDFTSEVD